MAGTPPPGRPGGDAPRGDLSIGFDSLAGPTEPDDSRSLGLSLPPTDVADAGFPDRTATYLPTDTADDRTSEFLPAGQLDSSRIRSGLERESGVPGAGRAGDSVTAVSPLNYIVERELGRGGMGVVYLARQVGLKRPVALKMILPGVVSDTDRARFAVEAEAVARIAHPNIVQVYEVGECQGLPFMSLEFCPGGGLDRKLKAGPLTPRESARLAADLAFAMQAAHAAGIVHRDLKPANVLLDAQGTPKVTDFGLAKRMDADDGQTRTGAIMGTPMYMSPEQAGGFTEELGPATDIWTLGAMLYEFLTGRVPFRGSTVLETLALIQTEEPVRPRVLTPSAPADLETIALKCLEKDPARRYPSAGELGADLTRWLEGRAIEARPVGGLERAAKWARRKPAAAGLFGTAALLALAVLGGVLAFARSESLKAQAAARELADERREAEGRLRADAMSASARLAAGAGRLQDARRDWAAALEAAKVLSDAGERVPPIEHELSALEARLAEERRRDADRAVASAFAADADAARGHETFFTGEDDEASRAAAGASALAALARFGLGRTPPDAALLARLESDAFDAATRASLRADAQEMLLVVARAEDEPAAARDALSRVSAVGGPVARATLEARRDLAKTAGDTPAADSAEAELAKAPPEQPLDRYLGAVAAYRAGRRDPAAAQAEALLRQQPGHFWGRYLLAICRVRQERFAEGRALLTACLAQRPDFAPALVLRGYASTGMRDTEAAHADFKRVLDTPGDPLQHYLALNGRGVLTMDEKKFAEADADLRAAIALRPRPEPFRSLGRLHVERRNFEAADADLSAGLDRFPKHAVLLFERAVVRTQLKRPAEALADFRAYAEVGRREPSDRLGDALFRAASLEDAAGETAGALSTVEHSLARDPDRAEAHRLKGELLLKLGREDDARSSLNAYFARVGDKATARDHEVRGVLATRARRFPEAVEGYSVALSLLKSEEAEPRRRCLTQRAGVYALCEAWRMALADCEAVLKDFPQDADARVGRAECRVRLNLGEKARADLLALRAETGLSPPQKLRVARCLSMLSASADKAGLESFTAARDLLGEILEQTAAEKRGDFWRVFVQGDPGFSILLSTPAGDRLAARYGRKPAPKSAGSE